VTSARRTSSPARLTRRLHTHPATMTGILTRLVNSGWIERTADPGDRRSSVLTIAGKRDAQLRERYPAPRQAVVDAISAHSPDDVAAVVDVLNDLASRVRNARLAKRHGTRRDRVRSGPARPAGDPRALAGPGRHRVRRGRGHRSRA
jgi:DNA-binding MarR family transcriptional regulator